MKLFSNPAIATEGESQMTTRRAFMQTGAGAGIGLVLATSACDKKDLSGQVLILVTSFNEIKPLLPDLGLSSAVLDRISALLDKGVKIAKMFDDAYRAGKFDDAKTLFLNLVNVITSVAAELNLVNNIIIKFALVGIKVVQIVIANLLKQMASDPRVAAAIQSRGAEGQKTMAEIERLAAVNPDQLLKLLQ